MFDYSDEESELRSIRKRNFSPKEVEDLGIHFTRTLDGPHVSFTAKTQSIFKKFRKKSGGLIMPISNPRISEAFFISEVIPSKILKSKSGFSDFGPHFKVDKEILERSHKISSKKESHSDSFYKSMQTLVFLAQFFAVFPVSGIRGQSYKNLSFKWIHFKTAYWGLTFLGTVFCFVCSAVGGLDDGAFQAASGIFYFGCGILSSLLMLNLSQNWKKLNEEFVQVEFKFKKYGYPKKIGMKFKIFTITVLLVALVEHLLAKLKSLEIILACSQKKDEFFILAESFFLTEYSEVFEIYSYSFWKGVLVMTAHFLVTANWNFKDLFLCTISWTIAERFKQVHDLLENVHGEDKPNSFWKEVREDYNNLSVLTKRVDTYIRKLMFLSIGNNLFFICIQLFHSLKRKIDSFKLIYFFWSFGFLTLRTVFVAFSAARINDESKEPKTVLYSVPQKNYTAEVRRFLTQLTSNEVAFTGSGFFSITRSLILTITGSVITYEIVLVQFGSSEIQDDSNKNRTLCFHK